MFCAAIISEEQQIWEEKTEYNHKPENDACVKMKIKVFLTLFVHFCPNIKVDDGRDLVSCLCV